MIGQERNSLRKERVARLGGIKDKTEEEKRGRGGKEREREMRREKTARGGFY